MLGVPQESNENVLGGQLHSLVMTSLQSQVLLPTYVNVQDFRHEKSG